MIQGISDRRTFARLRSDGFTVNARQLRARHLPADSADAPVRVAYAIPRKVGTAVSRNRIRRRIRGVLEECAAERRGLAAGATLFIVGRNVAELDAAGLRREVRDVLEAIDTNAMTS